MEQCKCGGVTQYLSTNVQYEDVSWNVKPPPEGFEMWVYPAWHVFGMKLVANCAWVKVVVVIVFFISKWDVNEQG